MRETLFQFELKASFPVPAVWHDEIFWIEQLFTFVELYSSGKLLQPTQVYIGCRSIKLFCVPRNHLWITDEETSKRRLSEERKRGNVDKFYDIDVLRITEPRIALLYEFLRTVNYLDNALKAQCVELLQAGEKQRNTSMQRCLGSAISSVMNSYKIEYNYAGLQPTHFIQRRHPRYKDRHIRIPSTCNYTGNVFECLARAFSKVVRVNLSEGDIESFYLAGELSWATRSSGEPFEILGVLSRDCNAHCDFCYVLGNPSNTAIKLQKFTNKGSEREARLRLAYFQRGLTLPVATYDTEEITTHPKFLDTCRKIRASSSKIISITTNGYRLTEEFVEAFREFSPVDVSVSLNSAESSTRAWLMGGAHPRGLGSLEVLRRHSIPMAVTIAAWPRLPIDELRNAVRYADQFSPRSISVLLGGYTKLFPNPPEYSIPDYWNYVIESIVNLREEISSPLIIQPRLYEELYRFGDNLGVSRVTGTTAHSPASTAGIRPYDIISSINGRRITTRNECLSILSSLRINELNAEIVLKRGGDLIEISLDTSDQNPEYIYGELRNDRFGIHLLGEDIPLKAIRNLFQIINKYKAKNVLLCTSLIVKPFAERMLKMFSGALIESTCIDLQVVPNKFLGGNIVMGDMLVTEDFMDFIECYLMANECDLILVPSGPYNHGEWLRDMKGQSFDLLRKCFAVPLELLESTYFE